MSAEKQISETNEPDQAGGVGEGMVPPKNRWLKVLLLAFCCWHAAFLLVSAVPSAVSHGDHGIPALDFYRLILGGPQQWNMFDTIPVLHSLDFRFEAKDATGAKTTTKGCVLPGFKPYPQPERARYYVLFGRLALYDKSIPYRDAYLRKAAGLLPAPTAGESWSLVVDKEYTRSLFHIRRDRHISMPVSESFDVNSPSASPP